MVTLITNMLEDGERVIFWEECPTGFNEILTTCSHYLLRVYNISESSVSIMFSGAAVIVNML